MILCYHQTFQMSIIFYKKIISYLTSYFIIDFLILSCYTKIIILLYGDRLILGGNF